MGAALDWREHGPPRVPVRGDELARELGHRARARSSAGCSASSSEAAYAGEAEHARSRRCALARRLRDS